MDYGSLVGAIFGSAAQVYNNKSNIDLNKETNKANLLAQQEANALQVDLANTSHQREIADLKAAGLNPILSAGGQGASTPNLGVSAQQAGHTDSLADQMRDIGKAASSAATADRRLKEQQRINLQSVDANLHADNNLKRQQAKVAKWEGAVAKLKHDALKKSGIPGLLDKIGTSSPAAAAIKSDSVNSATKSNRDRTAEKQMLRELGRDYGLDDMTDADIKALIEYGNPPPAGARDRLLPILSP